MIEQEEIAKTRAKHALECYPTMCKCTNLMRVLDSLEQCYIELAGKRAAVDQARLREEARTEEWKSRALKAEAALEAEREQRWNDNHGSWCKAP